MKQLNGWVGLTRRALTRTRGARAVAAAVSRGILSGKVGRSKTAAAGDSLLMMLEINGVSYQLPVEPSWTLLDVLREKLGFSAAEIGCECGECGACTLLIDDLPRYACMTLAVEAEGARIKTEAGLMGSDRQVASWCTHPTWHPP